MLTEEEEEIKQELQRLSKLFECPICLCLMSEVMVTRCVHRFCAQCISKAIETSSSDFCRCPLCNEKITKRALRKQEDVNDMVDALKKAVHSFETDCQMKVITDANNVVVFDVSADKSKSCLQVDSHPSVTETIEETIESNVQTNKSLAEKSCNEANKKTTTITCVESSQSKSDPIIESIDEDLSKESGATDNYFQQSDNSLSNKGELILVSEERQSDSHNYIRPTQSQDLIVTKPKITYGSSRRSHSDDLFDRIVLRPSLDRNCRNSNQISSKSVEIIPESEKPFETSDEQIIHRKPLNHLNNEQKSRSQTIQAIGSSEESSPVVVVKTKRKVTKIEDSSQDSRENGAQTEEEKGGNDFGLRFRTISDDESEDDTQDLFLPTLEPTNEVIRGNNSVLSESSDGYRSDTQLITSSPFTSELF